MNWIGISTRALVGALVAAVLGFVMYGFLLGRGVEAPWIVAIVTGVASALGSADKSVTRGLVIGTLAVWVAAGAQAFFHPIEVGEPVWRGLARFHETLGLGRCLAFAVTAGVAIGLGGLWTPLARSAAEPQPR